MQKDIIVFMDHVVVCGQTIYRPEYIPRGEWMDFWDKVRQ